MPSSDRQAKPVATHDHAPHGVARSISGPDTRIVATAHTLSASPRVRSLSALGPTLSGAPVQRVVKQARDTWGKWYTTLDSKTQFDSHAEAADHERALLEARAAVKEEKKKKRDEKKRERYEEEIRNFSGTTIEAGSDARVWNSKGGYKDSPIFTLDPETTKTHMEKAMIERRGGAKETSVLDLHGSHYVATPGTDLSITELQPESKKVKESEGKMPLRRVGQPNKYSTLGPPLDRIAERHTPEGGDHSETRKRMGKDIERLSRANHPLPHPEGLDYSDRDMRTMRETALIERLDKARVPKATKYIRNQFTSGNSFHDLLVNNHYVGAPSGGVAALRRQATDDGNVSEGSDIEEMEERAKQRREAENHNPMLSPVAEQVESVEEEEPEAIASPRNEKKRLDPPKRKERKDQPRKRRKPLPPLQPGAEGDF